MADDFEDYISDHGSDYSYDDEVEVPGTTDPAEDPDARYLPVSEEVEGGADDDPESDVEDVIGYESDPEDKKPEAEEEDENAPRKESEDEIIEEEEEEDKQLPIRIMANSKHDMNVIIIKPEDRITSHIISKYEMTELTGIRGNMIAKYNDCIVPTTGLDDPIKQARRELMMRSCPLDLYREVGRVRNESTGEIELYAEKWCPNEMTFAVIYKDV